MNTQTASVATIPPRPTRADVVPFAEAIRNPKTSVMALLQHPEMMARMRQALPRHLSPERMLRVSALALQRTPKLADCDRLSLLGSLMTCGSLGLEPNTPLGHAYLIPFKETCTLIIGYKGFVDLARRSGHISTVHADIVYQGDQFDFEYGTNGRLRHVPSGNRDGEWLYAYAFARMKDGGEQYEVMTRAEVLRIRNSSQGYQRDKAKSPWTLHEPEMAKKTALRRLAKWLPLSIEFATAAALDELSDAGKADLAQIGEATDVLGAMEGLTYDDTTDLRADTEPPPAAASAPVPSRPAEGQGEPATDQREQTDPARVPVEALIGAVETCATTDELTAFWRDCEEARSLLSPEDRGKLATRKAEIEVALREREGKKR